MIKKELKRTISLILTLALILTLLSSMSISVHAAELNTFTVTYNGNGNTGGDVPLASTHNEGSTVTVSSNSGTLTKTDYEFAGWNTQADGTGTTYHAGSGQIDNISLDITLYAIWSKFSASSGNSAAIISGAAIAVDPNIVIEGFTESISGAKVMLQNKQTGDTLSFNNAAGGITGTYDADTGVLTLTGNASASQYQTALRSVEFSTSSNDTRNRTILFTLGSGLYYSPTGHFYEFVAYNPASNEWSDAMNNASARSLYGRQGYLATIISSEENAFIKEKVEGIGWIGAKDIHYVDTSSDDNLGDWRWVTGPEGLADGGKGTRFYTGYSGVSGSTVTFSNWCSGEPNNGGNKEYVAHIFGPTETMAQWAINAGAKPGEWNDFPDTINDGAVLGYIAEYGGMSGDTPITIQTTKTVVVSENDTTAPNLTAGAVTRTSDTTGTVKFTSDEAGQYYYAIVADGAGEPAIDTSGAGTACTTDEVTITDPTGLTAGAKDLYIKVKDAAGNVSSVLKIDIASYVAPPTITLGDTTWTGSSYTCELELSTSSRMITISVDSGYFTVPSLGTTLIYQGGTNGTNYVGTYDSATQYDSAVFSFTDATEAESLLSAIIYTPEAADQPQTITATTSTTAPAGSDVYYEGHFYRYVSGSINWIDAVLAAGTTIDPYFGGRGYIATATNQAENTILLKLTDTGGGGADHWDDAWMGGLWQRNTGDVTTPVVTRGTDGNEISYSDLLGATPEQRKALLKDFTQTYGSDDTCDGKTNGKYIYEKPDVVRYYWVDGPQAGQEIANNVTDFSPWHSGEPNGGDFVYIGWEGAYWDDLGAYASDNASSYDILGGYIVEFSGFDGGSTGNKVASTTKTVSSVNLNATAEASADTLTPVVGEDDAITLTVKDNLGNTDTDFDGDKIVTITGYEAAPDATYGSFNATVLEADGSTDVTVTFTDGVAMANLKLNKAYGQTIGFSIGTVTTPATNTLTITPTHAAVASMAVTQDITAPDNNGGQFTKQPRITIKDSYGNTCTSDNATVVTVAKEDVGTWTLTGTTTATASSGVATFTNLGATNTALVNNAQIGFTATGLVKVTSATVTLPAPVVSGGGSSGGSSKGSSGSGSNVTTTPLNREAVIVIVNGKEQDAGKETKITEDGKAIVTVEVNNKVIESKIDEAVKNNITGSENIIQVPVVDTKSEVVKVELTGDIVKKLEDNIFDVSVRRDNVEYIIPAEEFTISQVAKNFGISENDLEDIKIEVQITKVDETVVVKYNEVAKANGVELIFPPIQFEVVAKTTSTDGATDEVEISKFSNYVERVMEIPAGVDSSKITTGIVFNPDGTYSHVPTEVFKKDGKWYARLNSLTNSNYSVVWNPVKVKSVENHWSKDVVNDMASRLVIFNAESFDPNKAINRADFAEYIVRALGLYRVASTHENKFKDLEAMDDRTLAILIANEYGIVAGYPDSTFRPDQHITREEAMVMYQRAMKLTKLVGVDQNRYLNYTDYKQVGSWATIYVKEVLSAHVFNGTTTTIISPKANLTYAEAAQAIKNLLVESKLINK